MRSAVACSSRVPTDGLEPECEAMRRYGVDRCVLRKIARGLNLGS